jgi:DNA-binding response OmpR family regulator
MKRILVVEDDRATLELVAFFLRQTGYALETATTGAVALEEMRRTPPDAVLLDLVLPDMRASALAAACRQVAWPSRVPIALMTCSPERAALDDLPVEAVIEKPFE